MKEKKIAIVVACVFLLSCLTTISTAEMKDPLPDLTIYGEVEWNYDEVEEVVNVGVSFTNIGAPIEEPTNIVVSVTISGILYHETSLMNFSYCGVGPSEMQWCSFATSGHAYHTVAVWVDAAENNPYGHIWESNEDNNFAFIDVESINQQLVL